MSCESLVDVGHFACREPQHLHPTGMVMKNNGMVGGLAVLFPGLLLLA